MRKSLVLLAIVTVAFLPGLTSVSGDTSSGLVAYYPMNEGSGSTATDNSGNGDHGTIVGASWTSDGKFGSALSFSGASYVLLSGLGVNTASGAKTTVAFWMYWTGGDSQMPFGWGDLYDLWFSSGCFGFNTGQGNIYGIPSSGLANRWVHIVAVFINGVPSSSTAALYINGVRQNIGPVVGPTTISRSVTSSARISGWAAMSGYYFGGRIDDLRIYNRELTAGDVTELYNYQPQSNPDFGIASSKTTMSISPGSSDTSTITVTSILGFSDAVTLTSSWAGSKPSGVATPFSPTSVTPSSGGATSTMTVTVDAFSSTGTYSLTVTGTAGSTTHSVTVTLTISAQAGTYTFTVRAGATKITLTCTWSNSGTVGMNLIQPPSTNYTEADMAIYERITINAGATATYSYLKRGELVITAPTPAQTWMLQLTPQGVTTYTVNIEVN